MAISSMPKTLSISAPISSSVQSHQPVPSNYHRTYRHGPFSTAARQASVDVNTTEGCCLIKALISNLLTFATRRRKGEVNTTNRDRDITNENIGIGTMGQNASAANTGTSKRGVVSFHSSKSGRKTVPLSTDACVCDSIDDQMIDKLCTIPNSMEKNEWVATHTIAFFDQINGLCGTFTDLCTPVTCPLMSYPGNTNARWIDDRGKRHSYCAMRYIDSVMSLCDAIRKDQSIFPTKFGVSFPSDFVTQCGRMIRLLWHCCGHLYLKHWAQISSLNIRPQFSLMLLHLAKFAKMYELMDSKELSSLNNVVQLIRPPITEVQPRQRSVKRQGTSIYPDEEVGADGFPAFGREKNSSTGGNQTGIDHIPDIPIPSKKSGSWGGHSGDVINIDPTNINVQTAANFQRIFAETC